MSSRQASFFFEFCNESCSSDSGIICMDGVLHAEALPTACELLLLAYPAFHVLTACHVSAHSQLEADGRRYAASVNALIVCRSPADTGRVGGHVSEVGGSLQRRGRWVVCMPCVR